MTNLKLLWLFVTAIPDLVKLLAAIETAAKQAELERKVKDDLKTLHQAFVNRDAAAVNRLFSGEPAGVVPEQASQPTV